jgi:hypothetical protein
MTPKCDAVLGRRDGRDLVCGRPAFRTYTDLSGQERGMCPVALHAWKVTAQYPPRAGSQRPVGASR